MLIDGPKDVHLYNRYDLSGLDDAGLCGSQGYDFSEPPVDAVYDTLPNRRGLCAAYRISARAAGPAADSAMQCLQMLTMKNDAVVRTARVFVFTGDLTDEDKKVIKQYCINPVEAREASFSRSSRNLETAWEEPADVPVIDGFIAMSDEELKEPRNSLSLAMSYEDLLFCRHYFRDEEQRNPTMTEIRVIDTH